MQTQEFQAAVNSQTAQPIHEPDPVRIVDELAQRIEDATRQALAIGISAEEIGGLSLRLRTEAEIRWMRSRYATLDMSFTQHQTGQYRVVVARTELDPAAVKVKQRLGSLETYEPAKNETVATLPTFVCEWMEYSALHDAYTPSARRSDWVRSYPTHRLHNIAHLPAARLKGDHYRAVTISAQVKMPEGITPEMFKRIRRCIAYLELFDVLLLDRGYADVPESRRGNRHNHIRVGVLWAPTLEAWSFTAQPPRPAGDPAILVRSGETCYLVGYFDTPDEKPIDNLIREFSSGPLGALANDLKASA